MLHALGSPCSSREMQMIEMRRLYSGISTEPKRIEVTDVCRA
jgi:hypothetical protein